MDIEGKESLFREFRVGQFGGKLPEEDSAIFSQALAVFRKMLGQPGSGAAYVMAVYKLVDELLAEYLAMNPMSCHKGCGNCCYQLVCCSQLEMELIAVYLQKFLKPARKQIQSNARKQAVKFDKMARKAGVQRNSDGELLRKLHHGIACPYLSKFQRCLIYPVRPIECRITRTKGVCYIGPSGDDKPTEEPIPIRLFLDQIACNLITEEDDRATRSVQLTPLVSWPLSPKFTNRF